MHIISTLFKQSKASAGSNSILPADLSVAVTHTPVINPKETGIDGNEMYQLSTPASVKTTWQLCLQKTFSKKTALQPPMHTPPHIFALPLHAFPTVYSCSQSLLVAAYPSEKNTWNILLIHIFSMTANGDVLTYVCELCDWSCFL